MSVKFRHRLIKALSCGDFVLMNGELGTDGSWRSKNTGRMLVENIDVRASSDRYAMIHIGTGMYDAILKICPSGRQGIDFVNSRLDSCGKDVRAAIHLESAVMVRVNELWWSPNFR